MAVDGVEEAGEGGPGGSGGGGGVRDSPKRGSGHDDASECGGWPAKRANTRARRGWLSEVPETRPVLPAEDTWERLALATSWPAKEKGEHGDKACRALHGLLVGGRVTPGSGVSCDELLTLASSRDASVGRGALGLALRRLGAEGLAVADGDTVRLYQCRASA